MRRLPKSLGILSWWRIQGFRGWGGGVSVIRTIDVYGGYTVVPSFMEITMHVCLKDGRGDDDHRTPRASKTPKTLGMPPTRLAAYMSYSSIYRM